MSPIPPLTLIAECFDSPPTPVIAEDERSSDIKIPATEDIFFDPDIPIPPPLDTTLAPLPSLPLEEEEPNHPSATIEDPLSKSIKIISPKRDSILYNSPFSCSWEGLCDKEDLLLYPNNDKLLNNNINSTNNNTLQNEKEEEIETFHYFNLNGDHDNTIKVYSSS